MWDIKGPRNLKIYVVEIVRLFYFSTTAIETFVRTFSFTRAASETLVYLKETHQPTNKHSRPEFHLMDQS
jgi:hypothetical protein